MDNPTHKDALLSLLSSCFPCRSGSEPPQLPPSPRLQALLTDPESDTDAMSLHSTYRPHTRRKKKKAPMQLCGINLFGKSSGQIRLEEEENEPINRPIGAQGASSSSEDLPNPRPRQRYDSDAAPLPDSTIHSLAISRSVTSTSPTTPTQPGPAHGYLTNEQPTRKPESPEEELARLRAEKAARKARRKDRRERKARRQLALEPTGDFEGYPGSGSFRDDSLPISPPSTTTSTPGIDEVMSTRGEDDRFKIDDADPEDGEADMGAAVYTRPRPGVGSRSGSSSGTGTGTGTSMTGRTSTSGRRSSVGFSANNALGLGIQRPPPSPLTQSHIPTSASPAPEEPAVESATPELAEPESKAVQLVEPESQVLDLVEPESKTLELVDATPTMESKQIPEPEPTKPEPESISNGKRPEPNSPKLTEAVLSASAAVLAASTTSPSPGPAASSSPAPASSSSPASTSSPSPSFKSTPSIEQDQPRARPKLHIGNLSNNLPMSSPGAGPGPRTMENSPRLAQLPSLNNSPKLGGFGFPSPGLSRPGFPSAGLGLNKPIGVGFPSPGLGKSNGFPSAGLGLNNTSSFPSPGIGSSPRLGGGASAGGGFPFGGPPRKGSLTAGMGVALANRGD